MQEQLLRELPPGEEDPRPYLLRELEKANLRRREVDDELHSDPSAIREGLQASGFVVNEVSEELLVAANEAAEVKAVFDAIDLFRAIDVRMSEFHWSLPRRSARLCAIRVPLPVIPLGVEVEFPPFAAAPGSSDTILDAEPALLRRARDNEAKLAENADALALAKELRDKKARLLPDITVIEIARRSQVGLVEVLWELTGHGQLFSELDLVEHEDGLEVRVNVLPRPGTEAKLRELLKGIEGVSSTISTVGSHLEAVLRRPPP